MPIKVTCPRGHHMNVPDHFAGKRGKCSKCGVAIVVPQAQVPADDDPGFEVVAEREAPMPEVRAKSKSRAAGAGEPPSASKRAAAHRPAPSRGDGSSRTMLLIAGGAGLAAIVLAAGTYFLWPKKKEPTAVAQSPQLKPDAAQAGSSNASPADPGPSAQPAGAAAGNAASASAILSVDLNKEDLPRVGGIVLETAKDGRIRMEVTFANEIPREQMKGPYVGLLQPAQADPFGTDLLEHLADAKVFKSSLVEFSEPASGTIEVGPGAAALLKPKDRVYLIHSPGSTAAQLSDVPDVAGIEPDRTAASIGLAADNLREIGLALHNFHDAYGLYPPAVVYGPDDKPWHSWRVLILPFMEQAKLYNEYDFSVPWDDPKNEAVLNKMPAVFRNPIYGDTMGHFTHFAVITGMGTAFPPEGQKMSEGKLPEWKWPGFTRAKDIRDGSSLSIFAGTIGPERKIPWTKPEDVVFVPEFKKLGAADSFAAPFNGVSLFLFVDNTVKAIKDEIPMKLLSSLITVSGSEVVTESEIPTVDHSGFPRGFQLVRGAQGLKVVCQY